MIPLPFTQADNKGKSSRMSSERLVNFYAEPQNNAKYPFALYGTPGLKLFESLGVGPIRAIVTRNQDRYVVSGSELYRNGNLLPGTVITGEGPVSTAYNSSQLVIVADGKGYVASRTAILQITDPDWQEADTVTYLNGVFVFNARNTGKAFSSAIEDARDLSALDFATAESNPDNLVGVYTEGDRLVMAGSETIEFWFNDGGDQFPFSRILGTTIQLGIYHKLGVVFADNTFFFLANDLSIRRMAQVPVSISTPSVEDDIAKAGEFINASTYSRGTHIFLIFDFEKGTFVYDVSTGLWHDRKSYKNDAWMVSNVCQDGVTVYAGDKINGNVYTLDEVTYDENGNVLEGIIQTPPITNNQEWFFTSELRIDVETGTGLTLGQGSDPQIMMQFSDDGGKTWSTELWTTIGEVGAYGTIASWHRLGRSRERTYKFKITDPIKRVLLGLWMNG